MTSLRDRITAIITRHASHAADEIITVVASEGAKLVTPRKATGEPGRAETPRAAPESGGR